MVQISLLLMWALCMIGFFASVRVMIRAQRDIRRIVGPRPHRPAYPPIRR